jgi:hypothetical protein
MTHVLAFRLKVPGADEFRDLQAVSTSYRCHGVLRLDGELLTIEWGGEVHVQEVDPLSVRDDRMAMPDEWITVPVSQLSQATLAGGWWRPRLTLQARELGALAPVPSEEHGIVRFWYARGDRALARGMATALGAAFAAASPPVPT